MVERHQNQPLMNRFFLALVPSSLVQAKLNEYVPKVREKLNRQGMRWVRPEKWHVPVGFIGDADVDELLSSLKNCEFETIHEFSITLGNISGFPDLKRPGLLMLEVDAPHPEFLKLREKITSSIEIEDNEDTFSPHLTLSRMKPASTKLGHKLRDFMHSGAKLEDASWMAEELILFNSLPNGEYEKIASFPFARNK